MSSLKSDNVNGLQYDGLSATVPDLWLGPLYVSSLNVHYQKSTNTWGGGAKVTLPGSQIAINAAGPPTQPPDFGFGIKNGKLDHVGFGIDFQPPTQPDLFPPFHTVLLSHIGAAVGFNPLRLTGTIGLSAAHVVAEDGALFGVFATAHNQYTLPEDPGPELAPLASRTFDRFSLAIGGTASLKVPILGGVPLLHAYGLYEYPDYFEFGGGFSWKVAFLSLDGNVGGFVYPSSRKFNMQGGVKACLHGHQDRSTVRSRSRSARVSTSAPSSPARASASAGHRHPVPDLRAHTGHGRRRLPLGRRRAQADDLLLRLRALRRGLAAGPHVGRRPAR